MESMSATSPEPSNDSTNGNAEASPLEIPDESEHKIDDSTEPIAATRSTPPVSGRRDRTSGLSELSKQLRILQAKNESQAIEIDRLERQLRILADLQGISVANLRHALQQACESEALGELQSRVASLRAQLEAATLARPGPAAQEDISSSHKVANLELRIGELEEVEEKQRAEIQQLYAQLSEQKAAATRLEALCRQLQTEKIESEKKDTQEIADNKQQELPLLMNEPSHDHKALEERATRAETEVEVLREKLKLSEQQREASEEQFKLRNAQFKARFLVQDENIEDLEQQLMSLYAAFEMLCEEHENDRAERQALQSSLGQADAEVARQVLGRDRTAHFIPPSPPIKNSTPPPAPIPAVTSQQENVPIRSGSLLIRGSNLLKQWKKRDVVLYSTAANHLLDVLGDKCYILVFGMTTVERNHKHPFGFTVRLNPNDASAPVVVAAASTEQDYFDWVGVLTTATTGGGQAYGHSSHSFGQSEDREAIDLALALENSQKDL